MTEPAVGVGAAIEAALRGPPRSTSAYLGLAALGASLGRGLAPRVMVCGRSGSGRSTLLAALGASRLAPWGGLDWWHHAGGALMAEIPGFQGPLGASAASLGAALARVWRPETVAFVVPASEVDAAIDDDLSALATVLAACEVRPRVVALLSRVDELDPPDLWPPEGTEKLRAIARAEARIRAHFERFRIGEGVEVVPLSALEEEDYPRRWNLDPVARALGAGAPSSGQLSALDAFSKLVARCVDEGLALRHDGGDRGGLIARLAHRGDLG
ncbi:MAG: hypothetical protein JNK72_10995 [Myxococcales bacterium]|nr:hypothetical protein [Myxococcales bacterium]